MVCPVASRNASSSDAGSDAEPLVNSRRPRAAAVQVARRSGVRGAVGLHQLRVDRRHRHEHAGVRERGPDRAGVEGHEPRLRAGPQRAQQRDDQAVRVMQRQHVQQPIVAPPAPRLLERRDASRPAPRASAGRPWAARSCRTCRASARRRRRAGGRAARARPPASPESVARSRAGLPAARSRPRRRARSRRHHPGQTGRERRARHQHPRRRVLDQVRELRRGVERRQRHGDPTRPPYCHQRFDIARARLDEERHRPPRTHPARRERRRRRGAIGAPARRSSFASRPDRRPRSNPADAPPGG